MPAPKVATRDGIHVRDTIAAVNEPVIRPIARVCPRPPQTVNIGIGSLRCQEACARTSWRTASTQGFDPTG